MLLLPLNYLGSYRPANSEAQNKQIKPPLIHDTALYYKNFYGCTPAKT